jgi:hypothetical protein
MQHEQQFFEWPRTCIITGFLNLSDAPVERKPVYGKLSIRKMEAAKQAMQENSQPKQPRVKLSKYEKAFKRSLHDRDRKIKTYTSTSTEAALKN